uniref:von Hippel-Lindau disease tumour suppressor beta domain-containing protein n=1 Tax=Strigamia maritima TaxID=126957 RepID=T1IP76_STRMM
MDTSTELSLTSVLHSVDAAYTVYVQFQNGTERFVDIIWVDYIGQWIRYETLSPGDSYDVYTYVSHPWVFLDGDTGIRLHAVGRGKVFFPLMSDCQHELDNDGVVHLTPIQITVSVPVFTLKQRCLEIMCLLASDRDTFLHLNLPREVVLELQSTYDAPSHYRVIDSALMEEEQQEADDEGFNGTGEEVASEDLTTTTTQESETFEPPLYQTNEIGAFNESMIFDAVANVLDRLHLSVSSGSPNPTMVSSQPITSATSSGSSMVGSSHSAPPVALPRRKLPIDQSSTTDEEVVPPNDADDENENDSIDENVRR